MVKTLLMYKCDYCAQLVITEVGEIPNGWISYNDEHYCSSECYRRAKTYKKEIWEHIYKNK